MKLFQMGEYRVLLSPTKYILDNEKQGVKGLSASAACRVAGACRVRLKRKLNRIRNGLPYDGVATGTHPIFTIELFVTRTHV